MSSPTCDINVYRDIWAGKDPRQNLPSLQPGHGDRLRYEFVAKTVKRFTPESVRILDAGCNIGGFLLYLIQDGLVLAENVVGIDIDPAHIELARELMPAAEFHVMALEYAREGMAGEFDVVLAMEVLEHVIDFERAMSALASMVRLGGYLVVSTPDADTSNWALEYCIKNPTQHRNLLNENILRDVLEGAGFEVETVDRTPIREDGFSMLVMRAGANTKS